MWTITRPQRIRMTDPINKPPAQAPLASLEANLFGTICEFHKRTMALLRQSSLDDEQLELVADRIKTLLEDADAEIKRTKDLNVTGRMEAVYDEIKLLVDELQ